MRKLKLSVEDLQVDTFSVTGSPRQSGTVNGREFDPYYPEVPSPSLDACYPGAGGGGVYTQGTCIGPTYCCPPSWRPTQCGASCAITLFCNTCHSCFGTCAGFSCTDPCGNCAP